VTRSDRSFVAQRLPVLATIVATVGSLLALRVVWLGAVVDARSLADGPVYDLPAARGSLWDRNGALIATESYRYEVGAVPAAVEDAAALASAAAPLLGLDAGDVLADVGDRTRRWVPLAREVEPAAAAALEALNLSGLHLTPIPRRTYPLGPAAAHVTGFVGLDGKAYYGVEALYDQTLRGTYGRLTGALGTAPQGFEPAHNGTDLILTIDRTIQLAAARALAEAIAYEDATGGTIVVMDPKTGDILAAVSQPTFDPNRYGEADPAAYLDPAVSKLYEPGSVIKAMTMAAALESGAVAADSTYEDSGVTEYGGIIVSNWDRSIQGTVSMTDLLQHSLNVGAVYLADRMGPDVFYRSLAEFSFGTPTGVDLDGEVAGLVRTPDQDDWYPADLATNSFGQGLAATPMQVITAMAALANDGRMMKPRVVSARLPDSGPPEILAPQTIRQVVSPWSAREVRRMLRHVVTGYAVQADIPGYTVAGKTGTSEIVDEAHGGYEETDTIASFAGFLPVDAPRVVILVKIDRPNAPRGSDAAAPAFRRVAEAAISALDIPPDLPEELLDG
jgi:cell division protein FtsI/penicillin-binding protein 2